MSKKYYIKINVRTHTEVTRERNYDDKWDGEDTYQSHEIHGYSVSTDEERYGWDFILNEDPKGKDLFVVAAFYDTGDSFHREENRLDLVHLATSFADAQTILKVLEADYKEYIENNESWAYKPLTIILPSGATIELYTGTWKGYFERLRELRIVNVGGGMSIKF